MFQSVNLTVCILLTIYIALLVAKIAINPAFGLLINKLLN